MTPFDSSFWLRRPWEAGPVVDARAETLFEAAPEYFALDDDAGPVGELQLAALEQVAPVMAAAHYGFRAWQLLCFKERYAQLAPLLQVLDERAEALAEVAAIEGRGHKDATARALQQGIVWLKGRLERMADELDQALVLPGPTGEDNRLRLNGRGVWVLRVERSTPLAAVVQGMLLALLCGNALVLSVPPERGFALARVCESAREAGLSPALVQCLPARSLEDTLLAHPQLAGLIVFTGAPHLSLAAALAARSGAITPLLELPADPGAAAWASERLLLRLMCEQTLTTNLTAVGGNPQLLTVQEAVL